MAISLPGQNVNISPKLEGLLSQTRAECNKDIQIAAILPGEGFEGRIVWRETDVLIEIREGLDNLTAEYVAAHEFCHALQLARGHPIASGRLYEPEAVMIATHITDLVCDSSAEAMAVEFGFPMASGFEDWLKSSGLLDILKEPQNGRRYGTDWARIWDRLKRTRVDRQLGNKIPELPKEFWTLLIALQLANIIHRASSFGLEIGLAIRGDIQRLPLLSRVVEELLNICEPSAMCPVEESLSKLVSIFHYIKAPTDHIFINRPLTGEFYIDGCWQPTPQKADNVTTQLLRGLSPEHFQ